VPFSPFSLNLQPLLHEVLVANILVQLQFPHSLLLLKRFRGLLPVVGSEAGLIVLIQVLLLLFDLLLPRLVHFFEDAGGFDLPVPVVLVDHVVHVELLLVLLLLLLGTRLGVLLELHNRLELARQRIFRPVHHPVLVVGPGVPPQLPVHAVQIRAPG